MSRKGRLSLQCVVLFVFVLSLSAQAGWEQLGGEEPDVAFDSATGNWVVSWHRYFGWPDYRPFVTRIAESDKVLDPGGAEVYSDGNLNYFPQIAAGPNRDLVIWVDDNQILYGRVMEDGAPASDVYQLSSNPVTDDTSQIDVAWGGDSFLVVYWHQPEVGSEHPIWKIMGQIVGEDGVPIGTNFTIAASNGLPGDSGTYIDFPAVASNGTNWIVVYDYNASFPATTCVVRRTVAFDGTVDGDDTCLSVSGTYSTRKPDVAAIGDDYLLVYTHITHNPTFGILPSYWSQLLGSDGTAQGYANLLWSDPYGWAFFMQLDISCGNSTCFVALAHTGSGEENAVGQFTDPAGIPLGGNFQITPGDFYISRPRSAYDPRSDQVLVAWADGDVWGAVYESPGIEIVPKFPISADCNGCFVDGVCYDEAAACDDGLFCTTGETCDGGVCGGGSFACPSGWFCSEESEQCFEDEQTPIELISFEAEALDEAVLLSWETATEKDNAGFNLYRSLAATGDYVKITSSMLPAEGNEFTGASYEFVDGDLEAGTYYYKLEAIDLNGQAEYFGPVAATIEAEPQFGCGQ